MKINLKDLRNQKNSDGKVVFSRSRDDLALMLSERLGRKIHVTQIARWEDDPGNVPIEVLIPWLDCLGTSIVEQVARQGTVQGQPSFDLGDPYGKLRNRAELLTAYVDAVSSDSPVRTLSPELPGIDDLQCMLGRITRKPNIVLSGAFDAGKSTMANWLINQEKALHTQYQPATAVVTYVRHAEDKPQWLREDVVLLQSGFDPDRWMDEAHVEQHRIVSGNLHTLHLYGTHQGDRFEASGADSALVFVDAPILRACNLIDFPGYQNDSKDSGRADRAVRHMDALIYASQSNGFMSAPDIERLRYLIKRLPVLERIDNEFPVLGNLLIVATHAGPHISDAQLKDQIIKGGAERLWRELNEHELAVRAEEAGSTIDIATLSSRIVSFWRESSRRTSDLAEAVDHLLRQNLPAVWSAEADRQVAELQHGALKTFDGLLASLEASLADVAAASARVRDRQDSDKQRTEEAARLREAVRHKIQSAKKEHRTAMAQAFSKAINVESIDLEIRTKYGGDKKEAQQFIAGYVINKLQAESERFTKKKGEELMAEIDNYVLSYDRYAGKGLVAGAEAMVIPFDARASFIGGLAGIGSVGALSIWAASLGNLGGYIIAAKAVSVLSALGIATGGTASVMALISAVGGPIALGIGLVAALFFGIRALFGEDWQTRLARQVVDHFKKEEVEKKFIEAIDSYWDETLRAFDVAADTVENDYVSEVQKTESDLADPEFQKKASRQCELYKAAIEFFTNLPWVSLSATAR